MRNEPSSVLRTHEMRRPAAICILLLLMPACGRPHGTPDVSSRAIGELRELGRGLAAYLHACGGYPGDLARVAAEPTFPAVPPSCKEMRVLDSSFLQERRYGYFFEYLVKGQLEGSPAVFRHFEVRATWGGGSEERRSFWMSDSGAIRTAAGRAAGPSDEDVQ